MTLPIDFPKIALYILLEKLEPAPIHRFCVACLLLGAFLCCGNIGLSFTKLAGFMVYLASYFLGSKTIKKNK